MHFVPQQIHKIKSLYGDESENVKDGQTHIVARLNLAPHCWN